MKYFVMRLSSFFIYGFLLLLAFLSRSAESLECYYCENEMGNYRCIRETKYCPFSQDTCATVVRYTTPMTSWNPLGERRHFISKGCSTESACSKMQNNYRQMCTREKYNDWTCVSCCQGDGCNYDVYISGHQHRASFFVISGAALLVAGIMQQWM